MGPSEIKLENVLVGALYDFEERHGILLKIYNDSDEAQAYEISSIKSSEINNVPDGYADIPDAGWLSFEVGAVEVEPRGTAEIKMYLEIPYNEEYYGRAWVVSVRVRSVPKAGQDISLACHPRIKIETEKLENTN